MEDKKYTVMLTMMYDKSHVGSTGTLGHYLSFDDAVGLAKDAETYNLVSYYSNLVEEIEAKLPDKYLGHSITIIETAQLVYQAAKYQSYIMNSELLNPFYAKYKSLVNDNCDTDKAKQIAASEMGKSNVRIQAIQQNQEVQR